MVLSIKELGVVIITHLPSHLLAFAMGNQSKEIVDN